MAFPGGFGQYMDSKRQKQKIQVSRLEICSNIFGYHSIYFNGFTGTTTMMDIKQLVVANGGSISESLSSKTTIIVASQVLFS